MTSLSATRFLHRSPVLQAGLVVALWLAGEGVMRLLGLPIPGGIAGLGIAVLLLASRRVSVLNLKRGAEWFLAEMLLFFVPAVLAVIDHREFLGMVGLKLLLVILVSTTAVMAVTAFAVDLCVRRRMVHATVPR